MNGLDNTMVDTLCLKLAVPFCMPSMIFPFFCEVVAFTFCILCFQPVQAKTNKLLIKILLTKFSKMLTMLSYCLLRHGGWIQELSSFPLSGSSLSCVVSHSWFNMRFHTQEVNLLRFGSAFSFPPLENKSHHVVKFF